MKASKAVIAGYGIAQETVIMHNNIKHVPFIPTIQTNLQRRKQLGATSDIRDLNGKICEFQYSDK